MDQNDDINQIPQHLQDFLSNMINDAGLTLDDNARKEVIKDLFVQMDNFMLTTIVEELPADKLEEFTKMAEEGKPREELEKYLQGNIENANEVFARSMVDFRNLYLGNVAVARNTPTAETAQQTATPESSDTTNDTDTNVN